MNKSDPAAPHTDQRIDWSEVHQRLENARRILEQDTVASAQESHAVLRARAHVLAQEPQHAAQGAQNSSRLSSSAWSLKRTASNRPLCAKPIP